MQLAFFYANAVIAIITAAVVILHRNPVVEALSLALHLCSIAMFFVLLQAPFAAVIQVILYAGAIMVLFLFVVMLLDPGGEGKAGRAGRLQTAATVLGAAALLAAIVPVVAAPWAGAGARTAVANEFGSVESFARILFTDYLFPFEAASVLLLSAMIGALYLAKRELE